MIMVVRLLHYCWLLLCYCSCYTTTIFIRWLDKISDCTASSRYQEYCRHYTTFKQGQRCCRHKT